jgi:hypothetical protein
MRHFDTMTGYEFEKFVYDIFIKLGFRVQITKASGDGGIDLIAHHDGLIFKGKYLIQCKRWKNNVGEPELRDLYGTTVSENALKGILVTTSSFTKQAQEFSRGKNLELIDGVGLSKLIESIQDENELSFRVHTESQIGFMSHFSFDKVKFSLFNSKIKSDPNLEIPRNALLHFLFESILIMGMESITNGLVEECLAQIDTYLDIFAKGKLEKSKMLHRALIYYKSLLVFIKGDFGYSYELMLNELQYQSFLSPYYSSLQYSLAVILGASFLIEKYSDRMERFINSNSSIITIYSSVLSHRQNCNEVNFSNIALAWPAGKFNNYHLLTLSTLQEKFNIDYSLNIDEYRSVLKSYGEL